MNLNNNQNISSIEKAIAYFDVFNFPLTRQELFQYSNHECLPVFEESLQTLINNKLIFQLGNYFSLNTDMSIVEKRLRGEARANKYDKKAFRNAKLIAKFPYVKGVFISGSLSKGVMAEDGDVDYFIITKPNRLWIARTLLILYKKVILLNSRKYFCVNYFIDEGHLEIEQKNRFTATEIVTLLPMVNSALYYEFLKQNEWVKEYYINAIKESNNIIDLKRSLFQSIIEPILNNSLGEKLDSYFMKITLKKWCSKFGKLSEEDFNIAMKSTKRVSKHHPSNFQVKVLESYEQKILNLKSKKSE